MTEDERTEHLVTAHGRQRDMVTGMERHAREVLHELLHQHPRGTDHEHTSSFDEMNGATRVQLTEEQWEHLRTMPGTTLGREEEPT